MAFKMNKVKVDLCSYPPYVILGVPKAGKTTLFRDLVLHNYNDAEKGLLISMGDEDGYLALDDLQVAVAQDWSSDFDEEEGVGGLTAIVDYILDNNKDLGLKMVGLDTFDKMVEIGIQQVLKEHKKEKGTPCKSLNDAFGGFNRGKDRLVSIMLREITKLRNAGVAVFVLAHTKLKEKTDAVTGETYEQLTNNLRADIWSSIADIAQIICTINVEREIVEGRQVGSKRMMNFVSNGLIDCGSRFNGMPDKLELSAENFMVAFETGVKNSMKKSISDKEIEKLKKAEQAEEKPKHIIVDDIEDEEGVVEQVDNKHLVSQIQQAVNEKKIDVLQMKTIMKKHSIKSFADAESLPQEGLLEIVALIQ